MKEEHESSRQLWLGILVSVICLAAIFFFIEPEQIWEALKQANYGFLLLTAVGIILFLVVRAQRWRFMLENDIPYMPTFHIQNIGYLVNTFLPFRLGDVTQAVLIGSVPPVTIARGLSTVVMARILDMMFIVVLLPFTLAKVETLPDSVRTAAVATGVITVIAILILIVTANQRPFIRKLSTPIFNKIGWLNTEAWVRRIDDLLAGLSSLTHLRSGAVLIGLTLLTWLPIIGAYYAGMLAVHLSPTWAMAAFVVCAAALSVAAPSSPGQVGVFHAGVIFALVNILGQPAGAAASFAFLYHAMNIIVMTILGVIGLLATGATFRHVIDTTRRYAKKRSREAPAISDSEEEGV
ncbi:MAG: lysylphosphatidylglycerol synthase transmembrane domain-containing protein [Chloroflexota bacterium]